MNGDLDIYCIYQNARSLNNKISEFFVSASTSNVDVIALTETWLTSTVLTSEIIDNNLYTVYQCDRDFNAVGVTRGGGHKQQF